MITSIHQPSLFPWLGLLDKIAKSDYFVFLDDVPANKASYQYRNILFCEGSSKFLTLPVDYYLGVRINELQYKDTHWPDQHLDKFKNYYRKAPFFNQIFPTVEKFYRNCENMPPVDFIINSMKFCLEMYEIEIPSIRSSELKYSGHKGDLVLDICLKVNSDIYLSGRGAKDYLDSEMIKRFQENHIHIVWHTFEHPVYTQSKNHPFLSGLSSLDLLFFEGIENAKKIFYDNKLNNGNRLNTH